MEDHPDSRLVRGFWGLSDIGNTPRYGKNHLEIGVPEISLEIFGYGGFLKWGYPICPILSSIHIPSSVIKHGVLEAMLEAMDHRNQ